MSDLLLANAAPTGRLRLRTSHPLAQRLALLMPLRGPTDLLDLVSGRMGTRNGTPGQALGRYGEAVLFGTGNSVEMPQPTGITSGTEPVTFLWLQEPRSPSSYSAVLTWKPTGATNAFAIYQAADSSYHFACGPRAGSVPRFAMGAPTDGRLDAFALVCAGGTDSATLSNYTLYRNGVPFTTGSSTTFGANSNASARIGALDSGSDPFEGLIGHLHIVRGAMLPAEVSAWFDDPFALEDDGRRIWLPPQSAGASLPVGLASESDVALACAGRLIGQVGLAQSAESALALQRGAQRIPAGVSTEADTSLSLAARLIAAAGRAEETDEALGLGTRLSLPVGIAIEAEQALALVGRYIASVGRSNEADSALALSLYSPGAGASPAQVWGYTLSNGLTAEQTLVAIHTYLQELHRLEGLEMGTPLRVTPTSRTAGSIEQLIVDAGSMITVTRQ